MYKNIAFSLRQKADFKKEGRKNGKKYWYYQFPAESILIEKCDPQLAPIGFMPILKYGWQVEQSLRGIDTSNFLKDYHKLPISSKAIKALEVRIVKWFEKNKRHKYLVITYQEVK